MERGGKGERMTNQKMIEPSAIWPADVSAASALNHALRMGLCCHFGVCGKTNECLFAVNKKLYRPIGE